MRTVVTTLLDAAGLLLLAAGAGAALWPWTAAGGLGTAGLVVLGGSWLAARQDGGGSG